MKNSKYIKIVEFITISQAIIFFISAIIYAIADNSERWFSRWALGLILLALWGIIISLNKKQ